MIEQWVKGRLDDLGIPVYANWAAEGATKPYCRYSRISSARKGNMQGDANLTTARFQVTFYAASYTEIAQLRKSLVAAVSGERGNYNGIVNIGATWIENEIDSPEPALDLFSGSSDLIVTYKDL